MVVYVTSMEGGLYEYFPAFKQFKPLHLPCSEFCKKARYLHIMTFGEQELFVSNGQEVALINLTDLSCQLIPYASIDPRLLTNKNAYLYPSCQAMNKDIYFVSNYGVYVLRNGEAKIKPFKIPSSYQGKALINIFEIKEDKNQNLWMTSEVNGLFIYENKLQTLINYNKSNSFLQSDYLQNLMFLPNGKVLIGNTTESYLFDPKTSSFTQSFGKQMGFARDDQSYEIKLHEDRWITKNNYGSLDVLDLWRYPENRHKPKMVITSFKVSNKEYAYLPLTRDTFFQLAHTENYLVIDLASLNYSNTGKNTYFYQLEGLDERWKVTKDPSLIFCKAFSG